MLFRSIVHLPKLDRQQLQSAWFTALDGAGVSIRVDPVERRALPQWIAQRLAKQGQRVAEGDVGVQTLAFFATPAGQEVARHLRATPDHFTLTPATDRAYRAFLASPAGKALLTHEEVQRILSTFNP